MQIRFNAMMVICVEVVESGAKASVDHTCPQININQDAPYEGRVLLK